MKRSITLGIPVLALGGLAVVGAQTPWSATPPFGITEVAGPATVTVPVNGSIPTLGAGSVVQLSDGTYSGKRRITCAGTAAAPAFLRGPATLPDAIEISGTYCIVEGIQFTSTNPNARPLVAVLAPSNSVVIRDSEVSNPAIGGPSAGIGLARWAGSGTNVNTVILRNVVHDVGDRNATGDVDGHGIAIGHADHAWVLGNTLYRNSGDGLQINGSLATAHHIWIEGNTSYDNKQNGFWTKTAADVVFRSNVAHSHRPSGSSSGGGLGFQYDPQRVWFIANESYNNTLGFVTGSGNAGGRRDVYLLGNLWRDNVNTGVQINGAVAGDYVLAHNTVAGSPKGIENAYYPTAPIISSNIVFAPTPYLFAQDGRPTYRANLTKEPGFVRGSYRLASGSPAIDAGVVEAAYATFRSLYGLDITRDRDGTARPQGKAWDIGAYEAGGASPSPSSSASPTRRSP